MYFGEQLDQGIGIVLKFRPFNNENRDDLDPVVEIRNIFENEGIVAILHALIDFPQHSRESISL